MDVADAAKRRAGALLRALRLPVGRTGAASHVARTVPGAAFGRDAIAMRAGPIGPVPAGWALRCVLLAGLGVGLTVSTAKALDGGQGAGLRPVDAPAGWADLCKRSPSLCSHHNRALGRVRLGAATMQQLVDVNQDVNHTIRYVTDQAFLGREEYWSLPIDGTGDCEDFALEKRRRLMALGWPRAALLMTVVLAFNGEWHAVLTVDTDQGPLILDNMTDQVLPPEKTGHRFHSSQSREHPNRWVAWSAREFVARAPAPPTPAGTAGQD
ncbi:transglutaminase-like cysteine peptidase [Prosthecomicrobium hirschii]|uniref:transglutaminase-like cysteine peptidase n=1 Tax=Prosthecodimorpha hirschii TaxID=665126 RepID=UPI000AD5E4EF|nr:transglutaminase-like cysteine peptidase [Prosthecomicrobium hirschii]